MRYLGRRSAVPGRPQIGGHRLTQIAVAGDAPLPKAPAAPILDDAALLALVLASLDDDKAEDVVTIPLRGKTEIADHMVVASGRSTRQVTAIAEKLMDRLKHQAGLIARAEGLEAGDWVLIDAGDVIVHVFRPEVREFYQLEKMWSPAAPGTAASGTAAPRR